MIAHQSGSMLFAMGIGRPLLERFLDRFSADIIPREATLEDFRVAFERSLASGNGRWAAAREALAAIWELATPLGQQRLERALEAAGVPVPGPPPMSRAELALRVWLDHPELFRREHALHRAARLSTFRHFRAAPGKEPRAAPRDVPPGLLRLIEEDCDHWFAAHNRGDRNTRVFLCGPASPGGAAPAAAGDLLFVVRHGDTLCAEPAIEQGRTEILRFRPARDDVVVYSSAFDELRINAGTFGEQRLYLAAFSRRLFRDRDYFKPAPVCSLAPLARDGPDALDPSGVPEISRVVLREYELLVDPALERVEVHKARDIFEVARLAGAAQPIPEEACLLSAKFDVHFASGLKPCKLQIRPPNTIRFSPSCPHGPVLEWLTLRGFRMPKPSPVGSESVTTNRSGHAVGRR
jgi:hypothetical protein